MNSKKITNTVGKIEFLEGLRGGAAVIVMIQHLNDAFCFSKWAHLNVPSSLDFFYKFLSVLLFAFHDGLMAVWIFWVLSGFVLSIGFFEAPKDKHSEWLVLKRGFLRRYPRLFGPVFVSIFFAYLLLRFHYMHNQELTFILGVGKNEWIAALYNFDPNIVMALKSAFWDSFFQFDHDTSYNITLWTIEKEMYGGIFLYVFLGLFGHYLIRIIAYAIITVALLFMPQVYLKAFLFGILICDIFVHQKEILDFMPLAIVSIVRKTRNNFFMAVSLGFLLIVAVGLDARVLNWRFHSRLGILIVSFALYFFPMQRILCHKALLFFGKISFGLYLVHIPLICSFGCWFYLILGHHIHGIWTGIITSIFTGIIALWGGALLYYVVDRPGTTWSRRLVDRFIR